MADDKKTKGLMADTRERLVWLVRPIGLLGLILFCLSPAVVAKPQIQDQALLAFMGGVVLGLYWYYADFYMYIFKRTDKSELTNQLPDTFYWGKKVAILFKK